MKLKTASSKILPKCRQVIVFLTIVLLSSPCFSQEKVKLQVSSATKTLGYGPLWAAAQPVEIW